MEIGPDDVGQKMGESDPESERILDKSDQIIGLFFLGVGLKEIMGIFTMKFFPRITKAQTLFKKIRQLSSPLYVAISDLGRVPQETVHYEGRNIQYNCS